MPILLILLLAFLVAQFGFWDSLAGILGGIGILILMMLTGAAVLAVMAVLALRRMGRR